MKTYYEKNFGSVLAEKRSARFNDMYVPSKLSGNGLAIEVYKRKETAKNKLAGGYTTSVGFAPSSRTSAIRKTLDAKENIAEQKIKRSKSKAGSTTISGTHNRQMHSLHSQHGSQPSFSNLVDSRSGQRSAAGIAHTVK